MKKKDIGFIDNKERENHNPIDEARHYQKANDGYGKTVRDLETIYGENFSYYSRKIQLLDLPDKTVICGHQRVKIAKELKIEHLRCKTVYNLDTPEKIREYVILDNLLRRQLTPEKQAFLLDDLSKQYETGRGFTGERKEDGTFKPKEDKLSSLGKPLSPEKTALLIDELSKQEKEDVNKKTAKKVKENGKWLISPGL